MPRKINLKNFRKLGLKKTIKKIFQKKIYRRLFIGLSLSILFVAVAFFAFNLIYQERILPHTYIGGYNFGGLNHAEAEVLLSEIIAKSENAQLNYSWTDKSYPISLKDLKVDYSAEKDHTVDTLLGVGRYGSVGRVIKENLRSIFLKNEVQAGFNFEKDILNDYLLKIAKDIDRDEKDATIEIQNRHPVVVQEEIGQKFDFIFNRDITLRYIGNFSFAANMPFAINRILPKISSETAKRAIPETEALLSRQLTMTGANKTFQIQPDDIAGMIEFVASLNQKNPLTQPKNIVSAYVLLPEISQAKVDDLVSRIAGEVYQEPKDPKFQVSGGRVAAFQIGQTGYELEKEKAISQIIEALKKDQKVLELPVKVTESAFSSDDPAKLGLNDLISEGKTSWRGSPSNRIHNLTLGAEKISGTIVKPGEEFSTIKAIAPIDANAGFLPELVIKNSTEVKPEVGGGLCQVSTTLFRAVLNAGLKITARSPHSFRVSYYEPPVGMDATIYDPAPDFRFVNNMSTPIFIWAIAGNNSLIFQIYGTKDDRKIEVSEPSLYNYTSPGEAVYTVSDTLAPGQIRQTERATSGVSASFHYKVTSVSGEVLQEETFVSKYVPIPNSYLYGPGTEGIPGQETPAVSGETQAAEPAPTPTVEATAGPKQ